MIFLMPIYAVITLIIIRLIMKRKPARHKWLQFFLLCFLFYLPVGWDVILGRAYFSYVCHKDGGIHIYETVELGPEHWNEDGSPKFYTERGDFDESYFGGRYKYESTLTDKSFIPKLSVSRHLSQIIDEGTGFILGEIVTYLYGGGWVINTWQPFNSSSERCPRYSDYPIPSDFDDNPMTKKTDPWGYRKFGSYVFLKK